MAVDDSVSAEAGQGTKFYPLGNDSAGNSSFNFYTFRVTSGPSHGDEVFPHFDHIHYKANERYEGSDSLSYEICTFDWECVTAVISIDVTRSHH